jgi:hypothetical protein
VDRNAYGGRVTFRKLFGECCRNSHCVHYPRETGPDPLAAAAERVRAHTDQILERQVTEAQAQKLLIDALELHGYTVWRCGQRDARKTQDPGVPDLIAIRDRVIFVECKRPHRGVQSEAQRVFQAACEAAGGTYVLARRVEDLSEWLTPQTTEAR